MYFSKTLLLAISSIFYSLVATDQTYLFLSQFITSNDLVFDVGAHQGNKTKKYLDHKCKVICFEPQPQCITILKNKFSHHPAVIIEEVGLSKHTGEAEMLICSQASTISTLSKQWATESRFSKLGFNWDRKITIPLQTLDEMIKKHGLPKFCKIDVENHELSVLQGLTHPIPFISIEVAIETFDNTIACLDYLENLGYQKFNCTFGEIPKFLFPEWNTKDQLIKNILEYISSGHCHDQKDFWGDIYAAFQ